MFKFKSFLLSSAALVVGFGLSVPQLKAMEPNENTPFNQGKQEQEDDQSTDIAGNSKKRKNIDGFSNQNGSDVDATVHKKLKSENKETDPMAEKYPFTAEGIEALQADARKGDDAALKELRKRAEQGDDKALNELMKRAEQGDDKAFNELMKRADQGDNKALNELMKRADQGHTYAQCNLGWMYENGWGVAQEDEQAFKWYQKAAEQGHADAQNTLSEMYHDGRGVEKNYKEACEWLEKAAEQGHVEAQNEMGNKYGRSWGDEKSLKTAFKWYQKAAEQGHAGAQNDLAWMYEDGRVVAQDYKEAVKWYQKGADQGLAAAQYNLARMYQKGRGVAKDESKAIMYYILSGDTEVKKYIKKHLQLNNHAPLRDEEKEFSLANLNVLNGHLQATQIEHGHQSQLHNPHGKFLERKFALTFFQEDYQKLATFGSKLLSVFDLLMGIKSPGFMVTAVAPSDELAECLKNTSSAPFFSVDEFHGTSYLTMGAENCTIVKKFMTAMNGFDSEIETARQALNKIKAPYETLFNNLHADVLRLHYELLEESEKRSKVTGNADKTLFTQRTTDLQTQFDQKSIQLNTMKKGKIGQDLMRLEEDEENINNATGFVKGFVKFGVSGRNKEFLDKYDYLK